MQKSCPIPSAWEIHTLYSLGQELLKAKLAETGSAVVECMPTCRRPWVWSLPTKRNWAKQTNNKPQQQKLAGHQWGSGQSVTPVHTAGEDVTQCSRTVDTILLSPQSKSISESHQVLFTYPNEWSVWCHSKKHKRTYGIRTHFPTGCTRDG